MPVCTAEQIASEVQNLIGSEIRIPAILTQLPSVLKEIAEEASVSMDRAFRKRLQREFRANVVNSGAQEFDYITLDSLVYADATITGSTNPSTRIIRRAPFAEVRLTDTAQIAEEILFLPDVQALRNAGEDGFAYYTLDEANGRLLVKRNDGSRITNGSELRLIASHIPTLTDFPYEYKHALVQKLAVRFGAVARTRQSEQ